MEKSKTTHPKNYTCHSCASQWAEWWRKEPEIHTFDSSSKLKKHFNEKHFKTHIQADFPEAIPCPHKGCTWVAIENPREELRSMLREGLQRLYEIKKTCIL